MSILSVAPGGNASEKSEYPGRKNAVNTYTRAVRELWIKPFGEENLIKTRKSVAGKIRKILTLY